MPHPEEPLDHDRLTEDDLAHRGAYPTGADEVTYAGEDFPGWDLVDEEWSP